MNLSKFCEIVKELSYLNIKEVIMEPAGEGVLVRGIDDSLNIAIVKRMDIEIPGTIVIENTKKTIDSLNLIDADNSSIEWLEEYKGCISGVNIQDDKNSLICKFSTLEMVECPKGVVSDYKILDEFEYDMNEILEFKKQLMATKAMIKDKMNKYFIMDNKKGEIKLKISSEDGNFFETFISNSTNSSKWTFIWNIGSLTTIIQTIIKRKKEIEKVKFRIADNSIMFISYNDFEFLLLPEETL